MRVEEPDGDDIRIVWYRDGEEWGIPSEFTSPTPGVKWSQDEDGPTYQARELGTFEVGVTVFDSGYPPLNTSLTWEVEVLDVPDDPDDGGGGGGHGNGGGGGGGEDDDAGDLDPGYEYGTLEPEAEGIALYQRPLALAIVAAIIAVAIIGILYMMGKDKKKKQGGAAQGATVDGVEMDICAVGPWDFGKSAPPPPTTPAGPPYDPRQHTSTTPAGPAYAPRQHTSMTSAGPPYDPRQHTSMTSAGSPYDPRPPSTTSAGPAYDPRHREGITGHRPGHPGYHGDPYGHQRVPRSPPAGREHLWPPPEGRFVEYLDEY